MTEANGVSLALRVDHTGITVTCLDTSLDFWVNVLGFRLLVREHFSPSEFLDAVSGVPGAEMTLAMVEAPGGGLIELLEYSAPTERETLRPRSCDVGSVHVAFIVNDLDSILPRLVLSKWLPLGPPQTVKGGVRDGLRIVYVRGPDGVTIELLQPPHIETGVAANWENSLHLPTSR